MGISFDHPWKGDEPRSRRSRGIQPCPLHCRCPSPSDGPKRGSQTTFRQHRGWREGVLYHWEHLYLRYHRTPCAQYAGGIFAFVGRGRGREAAGGGAVGGEVLGRAHDV